MPWQTRCARFRPGSLTLAVECFAARSDRSGIAALLALLTCARVLAVPNDDWLMRTLTCWKSLAAGPPRLTRLLMPCMHPHTFSDAILPSLSLSPHT